MTKLQQAINHFSQRFVESGGDMDYSIMAEALEEIRDDLTGHDTRLHLVEARQKAARLAEQEQPTPQPEQFKPWHDVVEITGADDNGDQHYIGFEGVVTRVESNRTYKVQIGEIDGWAYFPASSLRLVYRLKPRAQEPQSYSGSVMTDVGKEAQFSIGSMGDVYIAGTKPAPFQVGDWVQHKHSRKTFQISSVAGEQIYGMLEGTTIATLQEFVEKIDPPASRFTFGQRVAHYEVTGLFIRYVRDRTGLTKEQCQFLGLTDNNIHTCYADEIRLLDEIPF